MAIMYKGFSTVGRDKKFRLTDFELVKQDLLNHFQIRKGEKLMNPNFGTIIWNVLYDPFTEAVKSAIAADVKAMLVTTQDLQSIILLLPNMKMASKLNLIYV